MKSLFLALALALSLAPTPSRAAFVTVAFAAIQAGAGVAAAFGAAIGIGTFATKLIFGVALSLVGQLFAQKPESIKPGGIQTEQTTTGDTTPQKFVVGRYSLEGHAVAPAYSRAKNNIILTYILEFSNIPVVGLTGRVAIDGQWADILETPPAGRDATTAKTLSGFNEKGLDHAWIWIQDGTQTEAHPHLVEAYGNHPDRPWTTDHKLIGSAYAILEFVTDQELFSGLPSVRFEVEGIRLYDPRKDSSVGGSGPHRWGNPATWEWTENPQVINYNILRGITLPTGDIYGGQVPAEDLPLDNWFAAMNECDVLIGDRKQFVAGFEIDTNNMEPFDVINEMNRASFAQMSEFGGVFRVRVGAPASAVMHVTDDDFLTTEAMEFDPFPGLDTAFNYFTGTYVEPNNIWEGTSADPVENPVWEAEDGGRRLPLELGLSAVAVKSQAQHLLSAYANDNRRFRVHRLALPPGFALLEPLDGITWTSEKRGYTDKLFEITKVEVRADTLVEIATVRERDSGDVAWTQAQDVPAPATNNAYTPASLPEVSIPAESIVSTTAVVREALRSVIAFDVVSEATDALPRIEVHYQEETAGVWVSMATGDLGRYEFTAPADGSYRFRARTFSFSQAPGPWSETPFVNTTTLSAEPDSVTGFFAEVNAGITNLEWDPVESGDLSYYRLRHSTALSGATWADATTAVDKVPRPGSSVALPTRPGTYLIKAVSKTGVSSQGVASVVLDDDDTPDFTQTLTDAQHPGFGGTKTDTTEVSGSLRITDPSTAPSSGTYDFSGHIETHDSTVRRVRARIDVSVSRIDLSSGGWDDIPGPWDTWPGPWDEWTDSPQFADTDVQFFISTTQDDPSGSPVWSDWRRFRVAEFRGRAFRFRAVLRSSSANVTPSISAMTAIVEYDT